MVELYKIATHGPVILDLQRPYLYFPVFFLFLDLRNKYMESSVEPSYTETNINQNIPAY